ncbi:unnamed protein product [Clonostachys rosea]|uniref:Transcription factor domain-containing protein n=1 Tax=Bionectria ochroleuca TaxID=29856 RepID=A0ABY6UHK4_BIOOC|nr:unnamed protein product [Clonostachys rosea]
MALRTALAIGISESGRSHTQSEKLFWCCMVDLAQVFGRIVAEFRVPGEKLSFAERYEKSVLLESQLLEWRSTLPTDLDFDLVSLEESELVAKQKVVLKLHIDIVRWYNCTYVLDASMVLLYSIIRNIYPSSGDDLFSDVEKSLEIYNAMKVLAVARRCAEITRDVLDVAKRSYRRRSNPPDLSMQTADISSSVVKETFDLSNQQQSSLLGDLDAVDLDPSRIDLYTSLLDSNLAFKFLNFEDWNAWSAEALQDIT